MRFNRKILLGVLGGLGTAVTLSVAQAQSSPTPMALSGPFVAAAGEQILVCAVNVLATPSVAPTAAVSDAASTTLTVTLQIVNAVTGAVLTTTTLSLPPLGSSDTPPDPCISYSVSAGTFAPASNLFVARIELNPQPLPPGLCRPGALTATVQVVGAAGAVRLVPFEPPSPCLRSFRRK